MGYRRKSPIMPVPLQHPLWERLLPYGHLRRLPPGAVLYDQGEPADSCFYIHAGRVKAVMLRPDGTEKILEVLGPGALLGEAAAFDGLPHYSSCIALDHSEIYVFAVPRLLAAMQGDTELALHLLRVMSRKQRVLAGQVEDMAFHDTIIRLSRLLLRLGEDYGSGPPDMRHIGLRLTHEQMASMAGCSRIAVTRALGRLREVGGVIGTVKGRLTINTDRLDALARPAAAARTSRLSDQV